LIEPLEAFALVQESVEDPPLWIEEGWAESVQEGEPTGGTIGQAGVVILIDGGVEAVISDPVQLEVLYAHQLYECRRSGVRPVSV
jgi:hypothetical protein